MLYNAMTTSNREEEDMSKGYLDVDLGLNSKL